MSPPLPSDVRLDDLRPARWVADPARSRAKFRVKHTWGLATVVGSLDLVEGSLEIDEQNQIMMQLVLDALSVSSGNRMRDKDLRTDKFFDVERHPTVTFRSTSVDQGEDQQLRVAGMLTAGGRTVEIRPETHLERDGETLSVHASTVLDHRTLGMTHSPLGMVRTPSTLSVQAVLRPER